MPPQFGIDWVPEDEPCQLPRIHQDIAGAHLTAHAHQVHVQAPGHNKGPAARQGAVCQDFGFFFLCHELAPWRPHAGH